MGAPTVLAQGKSSGPGAPSAQPDKAPPHSPKSIEKPKADKPAPFTSPRKGEDKMKAFEEANKPGPSHKMLEQFVGEWAAEAKDLTPGEENVDKGTMTITMMYGNRFMSMDFDGRNHGKFFRGGGMMGYNNAEKRFEATWADSMSTGIMYMTGSSSGDGKVFTLTGEAPNPMTGKKATWKEVITITSKDTWRDDFSMIDGGKEMKVMEITYTRAGVGGKKDSEKKDEKPKGK